jgi:hypothetical protein
MSRRRSPSPTKMNQTTSYLADFPSEENYISRVPSDIIRKEIAKNLSLKDVNALSKTNKKLSSSLFENPQFWEERHEQELKKKSVTPKEDLKEVYRRKSYTYLNDRFQKLAKNHENALFVSRASTSRGREYISNSLIVIFEFLLEDESFAFVKKHIDAFRTQANEISNDPTFEPRLAILVNKFLVKYPSFIKYLDTYPTWYNGTL